MRCKKCRCEIKINPTWGGIESAYVTAVLPTSRCGHAKRGTNPLGNIVGFWHEPDEAQTVLEILMKYDEV